MPSFSKRSLEALETCDPRLQSILHEAIKYIDFTVLEGHRGKEAQDTAYNNGNSQLKWPYGKHNSFPSRAVDIIPYFPHKKDKYDWNDIGAFGRLMGYVERIAHEQKVRLRFGIDWNGNFQTSDESFRDAPHIEVLG